jgi:hypothetical protein
VKLGLLSARTVTAALRLHCGKRVNKSRCQVLQNWNSRIMCTGMKEEVRILF